MRLAIAPDMGGVTRKAAPARDLAGVYVRDAAAEIIAAIPLEPAARIGADDPAVFAPHRKRLAALDAKGIEARIGHLAQPGSLEPARRKLVAAVVEVFALEHAV